MVVKNKVTFTRFSFIFSFNLHVDVLYPAHSFGRKYCTFCDFVKSEFMQVPLTCNGYELNDLLLLFYNPDLH